MTQSTDGSFEGKGRRAVHVAPIWKNDHAGDSFVEAGLNSKELTDFLATKLGKQKLRDAMARLIEEIFYNTFSTSKPIAAQVERAVEVACKKVIAEGWREGSEHVTPEVIVRRKLNELVSKDVAERYDIRVTVQLTEKGH